MFTSFDRVEISKDVCHYNFQTINALLFGQAEDPTQAIQLFQRIPTDQMHEVISYREVALVQSPQVEREQQVGNGQVQLLSMR